MRNYLAGLFLAYVVSRQTNGEPTGVCKICNCSDRKLVNCNDLKLTKCFPQSWWSEVGGENSTFLEVDLSNNQIGHIVPFPNLTIVKLNLRNNRIVKLDDRAFWNLTRLRELDLSENELTSINLSPRVFEGRYSVEYYEPLEIRRLDLSGNELHTLNTLLFEHLPKIKYLSLRRNRLKILDKSTVIAISSLSELEVLDLSFTNLKELPIGFLHSLKYLKELYLMGNQLSELPSDVLFECHNLVVLNLNHNPIKLISTEKPFPVIPTLKTLHLSHMTELSRIEKHSMHGLTGLDNFICKTNERLEFISGLAFAANESDTARPNVTTLDLSDNNLRYLNKSFLDVKKVKRIDLLGNMWSCDCENQWMVDELVPILLRTESPVRGLICSQPSAMEGKDFLTLYKKNYKMRCLDLYGNHPENDSVILITVFSLIIAAMALGLIVVWKVRVGTCRRGGRVDYSRAFYKPAESEEKY